MELQKSKIGYVTLVYSPYFRFEQVKVAKCKQIRKTEINLQSAPKNSIEFKHVSEYKVFMCVKPNDKKYRLNV